MGKFELHFESLMIENQPSTLDIAEIPWDTETFGFNVAMLRTNDQVHEQVEAAVLEAAIKKYADARDINLITVTVPFDQTAIPVFLQQAGFTFIDLSLGVRYENLGIHEKQYPEELSVQVATEAEKQRHLEIAGTSFRHGRYHLDPMIPQSIANQRYRDWLLRCGNSDNQQQILTVKIHNEVCGFSVVECKGSHGYMHLHAIESSWRGRKLGQGMIIESLQYLKAAGAETVGTRISVSNLAALNMHARLGGCFVDATRLLHWHRKKS